MKLLNPRTWFGLAAQKVEVRQAGGVSNAQNRQMLADRGMSIRAARFDNQFTTDENRQLWALSDLMSVDAQANFQVRRTLRMRGRYAYHNNPFVMGMANRLANYVIGSNGPKLHLSTGNPKADRFVEGQFNDWAVRVKYAHKLKVSRAARFYNGEGFLMLRTNPKVKGPVKLDLAEIECDQVSSPLFGTFPAQYPDQLFDGLVLDPWGNRETYHVLRQHPGAFGAFLVMGYEFDAVPARYMLHDYGTLRPAQQRGIPEVVPALDLFEEARRYRKAVLAASETAADHAGFIKTAAAADDGSSGDDGERAAPSTGFGTDMDYVDIRRRQMGVLPEGWDAFQMKAEQPVQGYDQYVLSLLAEGGQMIDMPLFIVSGDARLANMSSAYVATQPFTKRVKGERTQEYNPLNDQVFAEWLVEARTIPNYIPGEFPANPDHDWRWERVSDHADPQKMAAAQNQKLKNGYSPSLLFADDGFDFDDNCARAAADYGVSVPEYKAALFQSIMASRGTPPPSSLDPQTGKDKSDPADDEDES